MRNNQDLTDKELAQINARERLASLRLRMARKSLSDIVTVEERELSHIALALGLLGAKESLKLTWEGLRDELGTSMAVETLKSVGLRRRYLSLGAFVDLSNKLYACELRNELKVTIAKPWSRK